MKVLYIVKEKEKDLKFRRFEVWTTTFKILFNSLMLSGNDYTLLYNRARERICRGGITVVDYAFIYVSIYEVAAPPLIYLS